MVWKWVLSKHPPEQRQCNAYAGSIKVGTGVIPDSEAVLDARKQNEVVAKEPTVQKDRKIGGAGNRKVHQTRKRDLTQPKYSGSRRARQCPTHFTVMAKPSLLKTAILQGKFSFAIRNGVCHNLRAGGGCSLRHAQVHRKKASLISAQRA